MPCLTAALRLVSRLVRNTARLAQDVFRKIDSDGSNSLDAAEFVSWLCQMGVPQRLGLPPERVRRTLLDVFQEVMGCEAPPALRSRDSSREQSAALQRHSTEALRCVACRTASAASTPIFVSPSRTPRLTRSRPPLSAATASRCRQMDADKNGSLSLQEVNRYLRHGRHTVVLDGKLRHPNGTPDEAAKHARRAEQRGAETTTPSLSAVAVGDEKGGRPAAKARVQGPTSKTRPATANPVSRTSSFRPASASSPFGQLSRQTMASAPALRGIPSASRPKTAGSSRSSVAPLTDGASSPQRSQKLYRSQAALSWFAKHAYPRA